MAKYSLRVSDGNGNQLLVPFCRENGSKKEKVELYEIDLVTISLGKKQFIEQLKKSKIVPSNFDWSCFRGCIEYKSNHKTKYMPLLFEQDKLLITMLNFQNQYRYHQGMSEKAMVSEFIKSHSQEDFHRMKFYLQSYRDQILAMIQKKADLLDDPNLPKEVSQKLYSYHQAITYEEQMEYRNDLLKKIFTYLNFRRCKAMEYGCQIETLIRQITVEEDGEKEIDPDNFAVLTDEEYEQAYGKPKSKYYGTIY